MDRTCHLTIDFQHDVEGNLTIAMVKTVQFQRLSHPGHMQVAPPVAMVPKINILERNDVL